MLTIAIAPVQTSGVQKYDQEIRKNRRDQVYGKGTPRNLYGALRKARVYTFP